MRFFAEDVHKAWTKCTRESTKPLADSLVVIQDFPPPESADLDSNTKTGPTNKRRKLSHGIAALDIDYTQQKPHVEKGKSLIEFEQEGACAVCHADLQHHGGIYAICPNPGCEAMSHLTCLSKHFLKNNKDTLVPVKGSCPKCKVELRWIDIAKELSLRMRGQKQMEKLLKGKRVRKAKAATASQAAMESSDIEEDSDDEDLEMETEEELNQLQELDREFGDSWHAIDDSEDSNDAGSVTSITSRTSQKSIPHRATNKAGNLGTVIEDSDWDSSCGSP